MVQFRVGKTGQGSGFGRPLGGAGEGWRTIAAVFDRAAVLTGFEQIGGADRALEMARDYALERAEEWLVLFKLPADRYGELAAFITERHSYDEPEIIALPILTGSAAYLNWMREETRPVDPAQGVLSHPATARAARSRTR